MVPDQAVDTAISRLHYDLGQAIEVQVRNRQQIVGRKRYQAWAIGRVWTLIPTFPAA